MNSSFTDTAAAEVLRKELAQSEPGSVFEFLLITALRIELRRHCDAANEREECLGEIELIDGMKLCSVHRGMYAEFSNDLLSVDY